MNRILKIGEYRFLMWLIPFPVSLVIYPIKTFANPLFESIISVLLVITVVTLTSTYFRGVNSNYLKEGAIIRVMDIDCTYIMIPVITLGRGDMADRSATMS